MAENRVLVTYTTAPSFLSTGAWKQIQAILNAQFPLRNIHWKSSARSSIRTIQELNVKLVPFESIRDEHASQIPMTLLEKPLLHIYVVTCEPGDFETYKNVVKKQVKEWHTAVSSRKNQEWLILHLAKGDTPLPTSGKLFQLKGSVLDKLKTDFNHDKRDRCIQVVWSTANDNILAWGEFGNKVKESLMTAFDAAISQREEEVRRSESQQAMPGWNFCTFFILKESLASSFEGMNLLEEALLQFDELETLFNHIWREQNFSWFGSLINVGPEDDTLPFLSVAKKPYRDLILANTISVFDFRTFLIARQCELLAKLGRINEITTKASGFLAAFGQRLRAVTELLPPFFIESWVHSSSISIAQQFDIWFSDGRLDAPRQGLLYASKGELYETARRQLDIVGVHVQHIPAKPPFARSSSPHPDTMQTKSTMTISNQALLEAIRNRDAFYKLYTDITNRAISMYTKAGRRKSALKLHGSLAALDLHRGQLENALTTYTSLPAHYAPHTWTSLECYMLSLALDTHSESNKPNDNEWLHILLSYLKCFIDLQGMELLLHEDDKVAYISKLISALEETTKSLESEVVHPNHPMLTIDINSNTELAGTEDGAFLSVCIVNKLPCDIPVNEIIVIATDRESCKYKFTVALDKLVPGTNNIRLFCPAVAMGVYLIHLTEIHMGQLVFRWDHSRKSQKQTLLSGKRKNLLLRVAQDIRAFNVMVEQSSRIELGNSPKILLSVSTGRNTVESARVRVSCQNVTWKYQEAQAQDEEVELETDDEDFVLRNLKPDESYSVALPHSDSSALHDLKINIEVEYVTKDQPNLTRKVFLTRVLFTTLPISVNVQDFFRGSRLISRFTISTTTHQHVRIASAELEIPPGGIEGVTITSPSKQPRVITITPMQPANFLFSIDSLHGPVNDSLTLVIKYRLLRNEVKELVEQVVHKISEEDMTKENSISLVNHLIEALGSDASWVELYGVTGELVVPELPQDSNFGGELAVAKQRLAACQRMDDAEGNWREIRIPVDIPQMHIVAAAQIRLLSTPSGSITSSALYAGQPISAEIKITTSFHWGSSANDTSCKFVMRYNVEEIIQDWLISGPKRGEFISKDDGIFTTTVTLLALHHGELQLPKIGVTALPVSGEMTMGSMTIPSTEVFQVHGAESVLILPRGGRTTFVVGLGST